MGWEQRGNHQYYYKKERHGSEVKSVYVGRGDIAHMISQIQSTSPLLERLARVTKSPEVSKFQESESQLEQASELIQLLLEGALLAGGCHTHKRQLRRKRNVDTK